MRELLPEQTDRDQGRKEPRTDTAEIRREGGELSPEQSRRKHHLERWAALLVAGGFLFLILLQRELINLGPGLNRSQGLVALVSINFSVLLMVLLILRSCAACTISSLKNGATAASRPRW
ncbi:hypothetical protein FACS189460_2280 [Deltaproteobacteria bacterium]|nr:hypothetical protein FACS189460_2280 [Deltaproteobacteria bacterium]